VNKIHRASARRREAPGKQEGMKHRSDGYLPIEDYAAIGDSRALALIGSDGSLDWMCLPQLDSPSVFAALLDPGRGGRFVVQPAIPFASTRRYVERTNVLETTFDTDRGKVRVTDALTMDSGQNAPWRELVRRVEGLSGSVPMRWRFEPRFDHGARTAELTRAGDAVIARGVHVQLALMSWGAGPIDMADGAAYGAFHCRDGDQALLVMTAVQDEPLPLPPRDHVERRLHATVTVWRDWVARHSYDGPWRDAVERSLLAIRLLADGRTGAIAAAGTSSLPEVLAGQRNYDYRFGWVRDLCFTLDALLAVDMQELTQASLTWVLKATRHTHPRVDPVYALGGEVVRSQQRLPLSGYRHTRPVHVGNKAGSQLQLGGFGDLIETVSAYASRGHVLDPASGERLADIVDLLTRIWRNEDSGLWELGEPAHYGTSKLSVWVAFDRALKLAADGHLPPRHVERWRRERDAAQAFIETELYSSSRGSYLMKAGSPALDCGMLLAARRGFPHRDDQERIEATIGAIAGELTAGGPLLYRYSGMREQENAFLACSFWMIEALAICGRLDEAAALMDDAVALGNDVGLFSEEMEPGSHGMRGNFPQALTHLSLISAADALTPRARPPERDRHPSPEARRAARSAAPRRAGAGLARSVNAPRSSSSGDGLR
jgi:GH15 family glucan-1,4-alpha-glucosidase